MVAVTELAPPVREELRWLLKHSRTPRIRTMREFAEAEIVLPEGPHQGRRFRCNRQPYSGLFFDAVDSGRWCRFVATGPQQSGKTLTCFCIPILYHLFEHGEKVIVGLPDMDMADDKWQEDLLPVIESSRFRELLPVRGSGSRGGKIGKAVRFRNGATLRFMSGGGSDKSRAGATSRVLVITETDGMDESGSRSREADKITQLEGRTRAYGHRRRVYMECTVSIEEGRTWQEYVNGTRSRVASRCPECRAFVCPGRDELVGWQDAEDVIAVRERARFRCPDCRKPWDEDARRSAAEKAVLLHGEQTADRAGRVRGEEPATDALGFRWSAADNLIIDAGEVGVYEWRGARAVDEENAERELLQFVWALPYKPPKVDLTNLQADPITRRLSVEPRGRVPGWADCLVAALDLGQYVAHWAAWAFARTGASAQVVDYGRIDVASEDLGLERGLAVAMAQFQTEITGQGWVDATGEPRTPDVVIVDSSWQPDVVYGFCDDHAEFMPAKGYGAGQRTNRHYKAPKTTGATVAAIGEAYHVAKIKRKTRRLKLVEFDADHWKTWVHARFSTPMGQPGAAVLFAAQSNEHLTFAKHLTAERPIEEYRPGRGIVQRWERVHRNNHWLDCSSMASVAGHLAGVRVIPDREDGRGAGDERPRPKSLREYREQRSGRRSRR